MWAKLSPIPDPMGTIARELDAAVSRARRVGIDKTKLVVDPGIGFGKRKEQNSLIIGSLHALTALDVPILVGPSRKSFLARTTTEATRYATSAAVAAAVLCGAHLVRVHDVQEMRVVTDVVDEILAQRNSSDR
jgi:dihydropteroate synthase